MIFCTGRTAIILFKLQSNNRLDLDVKEPVNANATVHKRLKQPFVTE